MNTQGKSSLTLEKVQTHAKYRAFPTTIKLELNLQERETCHVTFRVFYMFQFVICLKPDKSKRLEQLVFSWKLNSFLVWIWRRSGGQEVK